MSINFFDENKKTNSSKNQFGLCDDPPPAENPAYIDETNKNKWIGIVNNSTKKDTCFFPIDHCVPLFRPKLTKVKNPVIRIIHKFLILLFKIQEKESSCDGVLSYNNNLIFVELKNRGSGGWLKKGREQLTVTIAKFKENHDIQKYNKVEAYVCNSLKPLANTGNSNHIQQFKDETGLILNVQQNIDI
ncbi:MAG: hypothetical protein LBT25_08650 [Candidatus Symbiothrix sp.]|jgi:hypothetical protein|nr:hypothetical protein [Candidatus Symbiothrix sp.]